MVHNLVGFILSGVSLGLPENGVDHILLKDCTFWERGYLCMAVKKPVEKCIPFLIVQISSCSADLFPYLVPLVCISKWKRKRRFEFEPGIPPDSS